MLLLIYLIMYKIKHQKLNIYLRSPNSGKIIITIKTKTKETTTIYKYSLGQNEPRQDLREVYCVLSENWVVHRYSKHKPHYPQPNTEY